MRCAGVKRMGCVLRRAGRKVIERVVSFFIGDDDNDPFNFDGLVLWAQ